MVQGADRLRRRFARIPHRVERALRKVLEQEADRLVASMKALAPVLKEPDPRRRPGALRDAITWRWGAAPRGASVFGRVASAPGSAVFITIYLEKGTGMDDAFYAHFQEFGTEQQPASPFFFPVWRANSRRIRDRLRRTALREFQRS